MATSWQAVRPRHCYTHLEVSDSHAGLSGKVAQNAHISSAVNPAWRTAKTHVRFFHVNLA
jgi:hypothetical protein